MADKKKKVNIWQYLIRNRKFQICFVLLVIAVLLSFASIYRGTNVITQEVRIDGTEDTYANYLFLNQPSEIISNNLRIEYVEWDEPENITLKLRGEGIDDDPIPLQPGEVFEDSIDHNYTRVTGNIPELEGKIVEIEYTVEHYDYPYYHLSLIAVIIIIGGIYLLAKGYRESLEALIMDLRKERYDDQMSDYKPPGNNQE